MNKLNAIVLFSGLLLSTQAFAGASNAELNCISPDGVTLRGSVPGDLAEFDVTIQDSGKSANVFTRVNQTTSQTERNGDVTSVEAIEKGVYTMVIYRAEPNPFGFIQFYALPKTVVYKKIPNGHSATFSANLRYNFPELKVDTQEKIVKCTWKYEI